MVNFKKLRFDENFHLGLGDIRLTIAMQEEIENKLTNLIKAAEVFLDKTQDRLTLETMVDISEPAMKLILAIKEAKE